MKVVFGETWEGKASIRRQRGRLPDHAAEASGPQARDHFVGPGGGLAAHRQETPGSLYLLGPRKKKSTEVQNSSRCRGKAHVDGLHSVQRMVQGRSPVCTPVASPWSIGIAGSAGTPCMTVSALCSTMESFLGGASPLVTYMRSSQNLSHAPPLQKLPSQSFECRGDVTNMAAAGRSTLCLAFSPLLGAARGSLAPGGCGLDLGGDLCELIVEGDPSLAL